MIISLSIMLFFLTLIGLSLGSFLNVVIHRLPRMIKQQWAHQCQAFISEKITSHVPSGQHHESYNLLLPHSHCPQCQHPLKIYHNLPIVSFCVLKGRCAFCHSPIPWQYPFVELGTLLLFMACYAIVGFSIQLPALLIFTTLLIPLCAIDLQEQLLPDVLTYLLLWCGLLTSCFSIFVDPTAAIVGVVTGYIFFWLTANIFKYITHRDGLGYGDCKLLAALGAWVGWQGLMWIVLIASLSGTLITLSLIALKQRKASSLIPFGPFLALGGWLTLINISWIQTWFQGING
ncbi:MAG: prepilin peptidase [Gammaproteobacteria bacterium]